jgi:hypothetical protein
VFRATGQPEAALAPDLPWAWVAEAVRALWSAPREPCLVFGGGEPIAFAPYALTHLAPIEAQPSISPAIELFYAARERLSSHEQRREAVREQLRDARERLDRQRRLLGEELERARDLDRLRWEGEMIYGFLHAIAPGQSTLVVEGRGIALDPGRTPVENAQDRFHAYDKAKSALAGVPERLSAAEAQLAGLDETLALLELAEGFEAIEGIAREAIDQGYLRKPDPTRKKQKIRRPPPLRLESPDGYTIYVGRSAGQNEQVTFKLGAPDDLWLHARGIPGAHVIVKSSGRAAPEATLQAAAELAAYFSAGREEAAVDIDIARRALVRRVPNGPTGLVTYRAERTIRAAPRAPFARPLWRTSSSRSCTSRRSLSSVTRFAWSAVRRGTLRLTSSVDGAGACERATRRRRHHRNHRSTSSHLPPYLEPRTTSRNWSCSRTGHVVHRRDVSRQRGRRSADRSRRRARPVHVVRRARAHRDHHRDRVVPGRRAVAGRKAVAIGHRGGRSAHGAPGRLDARPVATGDRVLVHPRSPGATTRGRVTFRSDMLDVVPVEPMEGDEISWLATGLTEIRRGVRFFAIVEQVYTQVNTDGRVVRRLSALDADGLRVWLDVDQVRRERLKGEPGFGTLQRTSRPDM